MTERIIGSIDQIIENPDVNGEAAIKALQEMATEAGFEDMSDVCAAYVEVLENAGQNNQVTVELTPGKIKETLRVVVSSAILSFALSQSEVINAPVKKDTKEYQIAGLFKVTKTNYVIHRKVDPGQYIQLFRIYLKVYNSISQATGKKTVRLLDK